MHERGRKGSANLVRKEEKPSLIVSGRPGEGEVRAAKKKEKKVIFDVGKFEGTSV